MDYPQKTKILVDLAQAMPAEFKPVEGLPLTEGDVAAIQAIAFPTESQHFGDLHVVISLRRPPEELAAAYREACEAVRQNTENPHAAESARQRLQAMDEEHSLRAEDLKFNYDSIDQCWLELSQCGLVNRECTDCEGRAVFRDIFLNEPTALKVLKGGAPGIFHFPRESPQTAGLAITELPNEQGQVVVFEHRVKNQVLVHARLQEKGPIAGLFLAVRGENWNAVRVGWRLGSNNGVMALTPSLWRPGDFFEETILPFPFEEARRFEPIFDVEPAALSAESLIVTAADLARAPWRVGGMVLRIAASIAAASSLDRLLLGPDGKPVGPFEMDFVLPLSQLTPSRATLSSEARAWLLKFSFIHEQAIAPPNLSWQLVPEGGPGTGMKSLPESPVIEISLEILAGKWALEFEWQDEKGAWRTHSEKGPKWDLGAPA